MGILFELPRPALPQEYLKCTPTIRSSGLSGGLGQLPSELIIYVSFVYRMYEIM